MKAARHHERRRTLLGARIIFNNKNSTLECQIRNISPAGAKLVLSETVALPSEFDVYVPQTGRTFHAFLRWRSPQGAGIEFQQEATVGAQASEDALVARVRELESENELLRKRVLELMLELEKASGRDVREMS
jgi:hypothetical protein